MIAVIIHLIQVNGHCLHTLHKWSGYYNLAKHPIILDELIALKLQAFQKTMLLAHITIEPGTRLITILARFMAR